MYLSIIKFNLSGFLNFLNIQEILCSTASCFFHKSILSRICSVLQHPVFSRNLFYPGTALLCSAASCLFQESILSRYYSTFHMHFVNITVTGYLVRMQIKRMSSILLFVIVSMIKKISSNHKL